MTWTKYWGRVKESFQALSLEALSNSTSEFLKLARESLGTQTEMGKNELEGKKRLIDETLHLIKSELEKLEGVVTGTRKRSRKKVRRSRK